MKPVCFPICLSVSVLFGCSTKTADDVAIRDFGIYEATATISGMPELGQEPELIYLKVRDLSNSTRTVPAISETCFGFRIDLRTMPSRCHVKLEYEHPPFKAPHHDDPTVETDEFEVTSKGDFDGEVVWWFDDSFDFELVSGDWTFRAYVDDKLVAEKTFNVVD